MPIFIPSLSTIHPITSNVGFGDLVRRATISASVKALVVDREQLSRYLKMARASVNEAQGQLEILADIGAIGHHHRSITQADLLGRRLVLLLQNSMVGGNTSALNTMGGRAK